MDTKDRYRIKIFRIRNETSEDSFPKPVVFLQHDFADSADAFVMHNPKDAPAFRLIREGYDVWLGNSRGSKHSLLHKEYNYTNDARYWDFTFTDMGFYDLPAAIDFVRSFSGKSKITYLGHG